MSEPRPDKNDAKSWVADFKYVQHAKRPVTLKEIKESHKFDDWALVRMGRLSTMSAPAAFWAWLQKQGVSRATTRLTVLTLPTDCGGRGHGQL